LRRQALIESYQRMSVSMNSSWPTYALAHLSRCFPVVLELGDTVAQERQRRIELAALAAFDNER